MTILDPREDPDAPPRYEFDGKVYYRASALGICDRIFVALADGYGLQATPDWLLEIYEEGKRMEQSISDMHDAATEQPTHNQQLQVEMEILPDVFITGHIDGMCDGYVLREFKKFRDSTWQKFLRSGVECLPWYPMQTAFYMHALTAMYETDFSMEFVGGRYDGEKDEILETFYHTYTNPPVPLIGIKKRIAKLEAMINNGVSVSDVPCIVPPMYPCPMYYLHDPDAEELPTRPDDEVINLLLTEWQGFVDEYNTAKELVTTRDKDIKRIKEGIDGWLKASGIDDGKACRVTVNGKEYELKSLAVYRKGYEVQPTTYTKTSMAPVDEATGKKTRKPTAKKSAAKKLAANTKGTE